MISPGRLRRVLCLVFIPVTVIVIIVLASGSLLDHHSLPAGLDAYMAKDPTPPGEKPKPLRKHPPSDEEAAEKAALPITDNFPLAVNARSTADIPSIPPWNTPPTPHVNISTPLFIGFTRNWRLLQQTVVSYITAGWPPGDIYVVENTGVMHSNLKGQLSLQNPFYIDHHRLTKILGVNVIRTPTLFTFAQLQNFFTYTSLEKGWDHYFWAHMDTIVISDEEIPVTADQPYQSLYTRAVSVLQETLDPSWGPLAMRWFAYDRLALVRTQSFVDVGGWDTLIPFYMTDCDMHERLWMRKFKIEDATAGKVWDVASSLDDLAMLYRRGDEGEGENIDASTSSAPPTKAKRKGLTASRDEDELVSSSDGQLIKRLSHSKKKPVSSTNPPTWSPTDLSSPAYHNLLRHADGLQNAKSSNPSGRNTWQSRQRGGQNEPFYRDPDGFEHGLMMWMDLGRKVFEEKWGRGPCDIRDAGLVEDDAWKVVVGWEDGKVRKEWEAERMRREGKQKQEQEQKGN